MDILNPGDYTLNKQISFSRVFSPIQEDGNAVLRELQGTVMPRYPSSGWESPCVHGGGAIIGGSSCRIELWTSAKGRIPKDYVVGP
jgi:hypothetical protein